MKYHALNSLESLFLTLARKKGELEADELLDALQKSLFSTQAPIVLTGKTREGIADFVENELLPHLESLKVCEHFSHVAPSGSNGMDELCQAVMKVFPAMHSELLPTAAPPQWGMFLRGYLGRRKGQRVVVISPFDSALNLDPHELGLMVNAIDGMAREHGATIIVAMTTKAWETAHNMAGFSELDANGIRVGSVETEQAEFELGPLDSASVPDSEPVEELSDTDPDAMSLPAMLGLPGPSNRIEPRPTLRGGLVVASRLREPIPPRPAFLHPDPALSNLTPKPQVTARREPSIDELTTPKIIRHVTKRHSAGIALAGIASVFLAFAAFAPLVMRDRGISVSSDEQGSVQIMVTQNWLEKNLKDTSVYQGEVSAQDIHQLVIDFGTEKQILAKSAPHPPESLLPVSGEPK
tara:strand:+ start:3962 stop:5191 length:1230 start_codon:yes stop_codon:yes gene_type:complete